MWCCLIIVCCDFMALMMNILPSLIRVSRWLRFWSSRSLFFSFSWSKSYVFWSFSGCRLWIWFSRCWLRNFYTCIPSDWGWNFMKQLLEVYCLTNQAKTGKNSLKDNNKVSYVDQISTSIETVKTFTHSPSQLLKHLLSFKRILSKSFEAIHDWVGKCYKGSYVQHTPSLASQLLLFL